MQRVVLLLRALQLLDVVVPAVLHVVGAQVDQAQAGSQTRQKVETVFFMTIFLVAGPRHDQRDRSGTRASSNRHRSVRVMYGWAGIGSW
jgi:hypothetical protein